MDVVSTSPIRVASILWERAAGEWVLTVVAKATFDLFPGEAQLAREQDYINEEANYWNDDPNRSVYSPGDLAPFKTTADVVLVGHAFAPHGEPVRSIVTRLIVGDVDKSIEVFADRTFTQEGLLRDGNRFVKMPLRYERAAGGAESWNPVGIPPEGRRDIYGATPVPNLQPPGLLVSDPADYIEPIGYGPISPTWRARRDKLGAHAATWSDERWMKQPLPADIDPSFWSCAPPDQQLAEIRDDERLVLENLHPKHPRLVTKLPGLRPRAQVERTGHRVELPLTCDTLWIDTDRAACTVVWRGQLTVSSPAERGRVIVSLEHEDPSGARPRARFETELHIDDPPTHTGLMDEELGGSLPGLPFAPQQATGTPPSKPTFGTPPMTTPTPLPPPPGPPPPTRQRIREPTTIRNDVVISGDASPAWLNPGRAPSPEPIAPAVPSSPWAGTPLPSPSPIAVTTSSTAAQPSPPAAVPAPLAAAAPVVAPANVATPAVVAPPPIAANGPPSLGWSPSPEPVFPSDLGARPASLASSRPIASVAPSLGNAAVAAAAAAGAVAASDAAAAQARADSLAQIDRVPEPSPAERPAARMTSNDAVDLLWFNAKSVRRIKAWWKDVMADLEFREEDARHALPDEDPEREKARRAVFAVLAEERAEDATTITRSAAAGVDDRGHFTPPLVVLAGELRFPFDEVEQLKTIVGAVSPVVGGDKKLKESVDAVTELLKTPYLQGSGGVVQKIQAQLQEQLTQTNRSLPPNYLDLHVERALLEQRKYQKRKVFGEPHLRTLLFAGANDPLPAYVPEEIAELLPMASTLRVRLVAEIFPQQDQYETHAFALRLCAIGRVIRVDRRFA